jgi:REP element-mobilizing transposase RayT
MKIEYRNLFDHFIFTTLHRQPIIQEKHRIRIEKYITGIVANHNSKLYAIYANPDHVHFLVSRSPDISENQLATIIADSSEKFIIENKLSIGIFAWQQTASAFAISKSDVNTVCQYILNQPKHHKKVTFDEEYRQFMKHYQNIII